MSPHTMALLARLAITAWLGAVAVWDWRTALIPNWLTLPVMAVAGGLRLYQGRWYLLFIWALLYLIWRVNILGGGDAKFLMGLFALFPTYEFALLFCTMVLAISIPLLVVRHWGKRPAELLQAAIGRVAAGRLLPTREELERRGQQYAWTFCLPGVVYLWWLW